MKFSVDTGQIKTRELVECEQSLKSAIHLMSRFMVNEAGEAIPQEEAYELLMDLNLDEQIITQEQFMEVFLPKVKGRRSSRG